MSILAELLACVERREPVVLATVIGSKNSVPRRPGSKMLVFADGSTSGTVGGGEMEGRVVAESLETMDAARPRRINCSLLDPGTGDPGVCGGEVELYLEPHMPQSTIFVVGAGHVGQAVTELAIWLQYRVVVWDDRVELVDEISGADEVLTGSIAEAVGASPIDEHTRIIMVTRNVALDLEVLPVLLATPAPYIGLMGSKRRWDTTATKLREAGIDAADLERVHAPIGLEIAAETPSEIAVSILAEVIGNERGG